MPLRLLAVLLAALLALPLGALVADEPSPPAPPAGPSEADRQMCVRCVDELRAEAARIRGLAWKTSVPADLISRVQMRADFIDGLEDDYPPAKRARDVAILRRLGMLTEQQDPITLMLDVMQAGVGGYFDPKKKHLRIVEGMNMEAQRPVILHELLHALEDQYIDLEGRTKPFEDDGDRLFAEQCLMEGSAEHARELYQAAHPDVAAAYEKESQDPAKAMEQLKAMAKVPAFLFVPTLMHYDKGPAFVGRAVKGGSYAEVMAGLYKEPPVSQEQVLHPDKWFTDKRDYPQAVVWGGDLVATAGEGWKLHYQMPSGELDLALYLDFFLAGLNGRLNVMNPGNTPNAEARKAAAGWDAGWIAYLQKEGLPLVMVDAWAFDTPEDARDAAQALARAAEKAAGKAWKSEGWVEQAAKDGAPATSTIAYENQHGRSRLRLEGTRLLRVDGAPAEVLERLWPVVVQTAFVRDARDTWQPSTDKDPYDAASFRNEDEGIGLSVPGTGWSASKLEDQPFVVAVVTNEQKRIALTVNMIPQAATLEQVLAELGPTLKEVFPDFKAEKVGTAKVGSDEGTRIVLGKRADGGGYSELVIVPAAKRVWMVRMDAADAAGLDAMRADIEKILASVVVRKE